MGFPTELYRMFLIHLEEFPIIIFLTVSGFSIVSSCLTITCPLPVLVPPIGLLAKGLKRSTKHEEWYESRVE